MRPFGRVHDDHGFDSRSELEINPQLDMLSKRKSLSSLLGLSLLVWMGAFQSSISLAQQHLLDAKSKASPASRQSAYNSDCAGCHGLDGRGSDKAINIADNAKVRHLSDAQIGDIITNGVPGTGMPPFHSLSEPEVRAIVSYLRSLQGQNQLRTIPGNAARGKTVFFGKGECSTCHTISGEGGFLGPDLSSYGSSLSANAIRNDIASTKRIPREGFRSVVITTAAGDRLEGMLRNEDNFSVQLQTRDGSFHSFQKSELQRLERVETSPMPNDYRDRLSSDELNDLVSFLMNTPPDASRARDHRKKKEGSAQ